MTKKLHILIVDDDELLRKSVDRVVSALGHTTELADDGATAIEVLAANPQHVDAVITDYQMPEMDGLQLIQWISAVLNPPPLVLLHSGNDRLQLQEHSGIRTIPLSFASEVFPFVLTNQKPTSVETIKHFIDQV